MSLHDDYRWQGGLSRTGNTQSPDPFPQLSSPERLTRPLTPPPGYAESEANGIAPSTPLPQGMSITYSNDTEESGRLTPTLEPYPASRALSPPSRWPSTPYPGTLLYPNEHSGQSTFQISPNQSNNWPMTGIPPPNRWPDPGPPVYQPSRQGQTSSWGWSPVNIEPYPSSAQNPYNYGYNNAQRVPSVTSPEPNTLRYAYNYQPNNLPMAGRGPNVWTQQTQPVPPSWSTQDSTPHREQSVHSPSTNPLGCHPAPSDRQPSVRQPSAPGPYNPVSGNRPLTRDLTMHMPPPSYFARASGREKTDPRNIIQISLQAKSSDNPGVSLDPLIYRKVQQSLLQANNIGENPGVSLDLLIRRKAQLLNGDTRLLESRFDRNGCIYLSFEVSSVLCQANDVI